MFKNKFLVLLAVLLVVNNCSAEKSIAAKKNSSEKKATYLPESSKGAQILTDLIAVAGASVATYRLGLKTNEYLRDYNDKSLKALVVSYVTVGAALGVCCLVEKTYNDTGNYIYSKVAEMHATMHDDQVIDVQEQVVENN